MCRINKKWQSEVLVAQTAVKPTAADVNVFWWKEYRVRPLSGDAFDGLRAAGKLGAFASHQPFLIESRRVDGTADRVATNPWEWNVWMTGATPEAVIAEMMGDSLFSQAESLVPEHAVIARHRAERRAAILAEQAAQTAYADACAELKAFKDRHNAEYVKKSADKDEAAAKKIADRIMTRVKPQLDALRDAVKETESLFQTAKKAAAAIEKREPKLGDFPDLVAKFAA